MTKTTLFHIDTTATQQISDTKAFRDDHIGTKRRGDDLLLVVRGNDRFVVNKSNKPALTAPGVNFTANKVGDVFLQPGQVAKLQSFGSGWSFGRIQFGKANKTFLKTI